MRTLSTQNQPGVGWQWILTEDGHAVAAGGCFGLESTAWRDGFSRLTREEQRGALVEKSRAVSAAVFDMNISPEMHATAAALAAHEAIVRAVAAYITAGYGSHVTDALTQAAGLVEWSIREVRS